MLERALRRLPIALGLAAILFEVGSGGARTLAAWVIRDQTQPAPVLRPTFAIPSEAGSAPPFIVLRPRDELRREAQPFILATRSAAERRRAVQCLANAVYYEAALEPLEGRRAVAQVVLNRVRDVDFPRSICGVVYQGWERPTGCQFSFTCNGALSHAPAPIPYEEARRVAEAALDGYVMAEVGTATHYHTADIDPWWRPTLARIARVGAHVFYGWMAVSHSDASAGRRYAGGELKLPQNVIDGGGLRNGGSAAAIRPLPPRLTIASAAAVIGSKTKDPTVAEKQMPVDQASGLIGIANGETTQSRTPPSTIPILKPASGSPGQQL